MSHAARILAVVIAIVSVARAGPATAPAPPWRAAFTADTEGHVDACGSCPGPVGLGGLARRATAVRRLRADGPLLLLDAGNAAFGDQSVASRGAAVAAAYDAIGYDVVNVGYRDFRYGKAETVKLFDGRSAAAVSANLTDAETGKPLFRPYVVKPVGGHRVAVIGLTESPAGLDVLPRLRRQLAGVRIDPTDAALAACLPAATAESDRVVLLFYGGPAALAKIDAKRRDQCALILLGDVRPDDVPPGTGAYAAEQHGRSLTVVTADGKDAWQVPLDAAVPADAAVDTLLGKYRPAAVALPVVVAAAATQPTAVPPTAVPPTATPPTAEPPVVVAVGVPTPKTPATPPLPPVPAKPPAEPRPRVPVHSPLQPKGLPGVGLTAERVNAAIDRGADGLWAYVRGHDMTRGGRFGTDPTHVLTALAGVHCGLHKRSPEFDAAVRGYLTGVDPYAIGTYQCGLLALLVEAYDDPAYDEKLRQCARYLLEAQGPDGSWNYGVSVKPDLAGDGSRGQPLRVVGGDPIGPVADALRWHRLTPWDAKVTGDNSVSQFALLGLSAAARHHVPVAADVWARALAACRSRRCSDGGWNYGGPGGDSYGSMACAGVCATAICRHELGEADPTDDPAVGEGLGWLAAHFAVDANPAHSYWQMYYLYSLERVGRTLDTEFVGGHEWYPAGARHLVDTQRPDGTWVGTSDEADPRVASSFALLFLTRATPPLAAPVRHGEPGFLKTAVATPPPGRVYVILDASGSMLDAMNGREKFDVARDAVSALVAALPDRTPVALRVYGHRKRAIEAGAMEDTALEIPMAELDRPAFAAKLKSLRPRGMTPLALSLDDAVKDLSDVSEARPATLVLLTDGGEDTVPRRDPVKSAVAVGKVKGLTFDVVGFDIREADWAAQLHAMCDGAGGHYWPAADDAVLAGSVRSAVLGVPREFTVADAAGRAVEHGQFGDRKPLPEGRYTLTAVYADRPYSAEFNVNPGATTGLLFDATKATTAATAADVPKAVARFCTHCGHALPAGAKFCPSCGTAVTAR